MPTKHLAVFWLLTVLCLASFASWQHPALDTSMMSLLPPAQQQPIVNAASEHMGKQFSQQLLVLITADDQQVREQAVDKLVETLSALSQVKSVISQIDQQSIIERRKHLFSYRYVLLSEHITSTIDKQQTEKLRNEALSKLLNPISFNNNDLLADPFGLSSSWVEHQSFMIDIYQDHGYLSLGQSPSTNLIIVNLASDAFSIKTQQAVLTPLEKLTKALSTQGVEVITSGLLIHANAGAQQAQFEMSTIGFGSLIIIVLIMLWIFKRFSVVGLILLPILVGCIVATSIAFLVFERVHIITFAFGAGLIGVAIDYALHYLCERQVQQNALRTILPGLLLGLVSSVMAYAAQAIAPFPGLRQMALFSVSGLIAAWLTVVLWLPLLTKNMVFKGTNHAHHIKYWQSKLPSLDEQPWLIIILIPFTLLALWTAHNGKATDDIRLLQTSPPALIAQEVQLQKLLGLNSSTQFLLLPCSNIQSCLENEEQLKPLLKSWIEQGLIIKYQAISDTIPSMTTQSKNIARIHQLYQKELQALFNTLNLPSTSYLEVMQRFNKDSQIRLEPNTKSTSLLTSSSDQIVSLETNAIATIIRFSSNAQLSQHDIELLKQTVPGIMLVDQVKSISDLMQNYRQKIIKWVAVAYLLVLLILAYRYKIAIWRIALPPILASIYTVVVLMTFLPGINLFHLMALFLVLGIGLDMGIFLMETHQAAQTWLAVTLSVLTSLLAFGLLALSQTPVLMHFGLTVLIGLILVWLFAILFRQTQIKKV